jgi:uncharacterized RDD family membrane protein YckC
VALGPAPGGPIYWGGQWWHPRPDGGWWKWDPAINRWIDHRAQPPPPGYGAPVAVHNGPYVLPDGRPLPPLARWWQRLLAWLLDAAILGLLTGLVLALTNQLYLSGSLDGLSAEREPALAVAAALAYVLVVPLYFVVFHGGARGATPGKRVVGIRVCDKDTGAPIGVGRAYLRAVVTGALWLLLSSLILPVLDHLWPLWDPHRQAWHDKVVNSVVLTSPR